MADTSEELHESTEYETIKEMVEDIGCEIIRCNDQDGYVDHESYGIVKPSLFKSKKDLITYRIAWRVYNTKDFGLPQNRERLFLVGHLGNDCPSEVLYRPDQSEQSIVQVGNIIKTTSFGGNPQRGRIYSPDGLSPTLTCVKGGGIEPKILLSRNPNVIRKLTPREFWRLQGFTDQQFDTCAKTQSNAQLYKQAGNSVSIPIVYELGKKIIEHHRRLHGNE